MTVGTDQKMPRLAGLQSHRLQGAMKVQLHGPHLPAPPAPGSESSLQPVHLPPSATCPPWDSRATGVNPSTVLQGPLLGLASSFSLGAALGRGALLRLGFPEVRAVSPLDWGSLRQGCVSPFTPRPRQPGISLLTTSHPAQQSWFHLRCAQAQAHLQTKTRSV